jgi:hypothetical protein
MDALARSSDVMSAIEDQLHAFEQQLHTLEGAARRSRLGDVLPSRSRRSRLAERALELRGDVVAPAVSTVSRVADAASDLVDKVNLPDVSLPEPRWRSRRWDALPASRKVAVMAVVAVEVSLATSAWTDLAGRSATQVRGSKPAWAVAIAVPLVGPAAYLVGGRRGSAEPGDTSDSVPPGDRHEHSDSGVDEPRSATA